MEVVNGLGGVIEAGSFLSRDLSESRSRNEQHDCKGNGEFHEFNMAVISVYGMLLLPAKNPAIADGASR